MTGADSVASAAPSPARFTAVTAIPSTEPSPTANSVSPATTPSTCDRVAPASRSVFSSVDRTDPAISRVLASASAVYTRAMPSTTIRPSRVCGLVRG